MITAYTTDMSVSNTIDSCAAGTPRTKTVGSCQKTIDDLINNSLNSALMLLSNLIGPSNAGCDKREEPRCMADALDQTIEKAEMLAKTLERINEVMWG